MSIAEIQQLGRDARELADKGAKLNKGEASLFLESLFWGNLEQCMAILQTLRDRLNLNQ